jgi:hypothetical protein
MATQGRALIVLYSRAGRLLLRLHVACRLG